jgi:hypothetical protein
MVDPVLVLLVLLVSFLALVGVIIYLAREE